MVTKRKRQELYGVVSATTIIGESVVDREGEKLGKVSELMVDAGLGHLAYAILDFEGKYFAVPWQAFEFSNTEHKLILNVDRQRFKDAPGFDKDGDWPDFANQAWADEVQRFYVADPLRGA
ncbi:MAG: PRC-barrel domain-containing protein [Thioalkalivibrio sp.]|nr:PRC-barrel domain-containing protein [Thioalkalivibrio sp.]